MKKAMEISLAKSPRQIKCTNTGEIFVSACAAAKIYNISDGNISACCRGRTNFAGRHPSTCIKLNWEYVS
jgi:hypothetical protein